MFLYFFAQIQNIPDLKKSKQIMEKPFIDMKHKFCAIFFPTQKNPPPHVIVNKFLKKINMK